MVARIGAIAKLCVSAELNSAATDLHRLEPLKGAHSRGEWSAPGFSRKTNVSTSLGLSPPNLAQSGQSGHNSSFGDRSAQVDPAFQ